MNIKPLDDRLSVTAQPRIEELDQLAEQGFRAIISNRPRGESEDQPDPEALKAKAESLGMAWHEIPVKPGKYSQQDIAAFTEALESSPAPVIGFCRTGTRVAHLWAYSQAPHRPVSELVSAAKSAGYDLEPLRESLENQTNQANSNQER